MDALARGWFSELSTFWPGQAQSLKIKEILLDKKTQYQHIQIFESETYGRVMALDGCIQITEKDEFSYQEMISHVPLAAHPNPKKALLIGGGDGAVIRELCRNKSLEEIHICEIDEQVIEICKEYFPNFTKSLKEDKRVHVHIMDGFEFLRNNKNNFDIIICDSSDPVGPAESLFQRQFYESAKNALTSNGILCTQAESIWIHLDLIKQMHEFIKQLFTNSQYFYTSIPTYPSGVIGFFLCGKEEKKRDMSEPLHELDYEDQLRYYNKQVHKAAFALPSFARNIFQ